ncbi:hypothetical protein F6B41_02795 [Microbacterium lushaniae]|nr:hypothetical protein F6B41_28490 [Microbacterium lushaniae]KAA9158833.1 hypothetical protein F6B41_02795 [Microbacterium lushaniae]
MKGETEYAALLEAIKTEEPGCENDDRYILEPEQLHPDEITDMRATCTACPLLALCAAYADAARPTGGFWAGGHDGRSRKRKDRR